MPERRQLVLGSPRERRQRGALGAVRRRPAALGRAHGPEALAAHVLAGERGQAHDAEVVVRRVVLGGADGRGPLDEDGLAGGDVAKGHEVPGKRIVRQSSEKHQIQDGKSGQIKAFFFLSLFESTCTPEKCVKGASFYSVRNEQCSRKKRAPVIIQQRQLGR